MGAGKEGGKAGCIDAQQHERQSTPGASWPRCVPSLARCVLLTAPASFNASDPTAVLVAACWPHTCALGIAFLSQRRRLRGSGQMNGGERSDGWRAGRVSA